MSLIIYIYIYNGVKFSSIQEKWTHLFSTIITKAQTIKVLERGSSENRSGALLLVYIYFHANYLALCNKFFFCYIMCFDLVTYMLGLFAADV